MLLKICYNPDVCTTQGLTFFGSAGYGRLFLAALLPECMLLYLVLGLVG